MRNRRKRLICRRCFNHIDNQPIKFESGMVGICECCLRGHEQLMYSVAPIVVATGGTFDILHPGHVDSLNWAREQGTMLIVLLNSDESVMCYKGHHPYNEVSDRAKVISGLRAVTDVLIFSEDHPGRLLSVLKPDIWVKGAEYEGKDIPERSVIESYGGKVVFCPMVSGYSTSGLVQRIRREIVSTEVLKDGD